MTSASQDKSQKRFYVLLPCMGMFNLEKGGSSLLFPTCLTRALFVSSLIILFFVNQMSRIKNKQIRAETCLQIHVLQ